ncbi:MAG: hypothetical protein SGI97_03600 [candidate division Zixibacteria bacterium]|nr:hypothetical protein [candidate division Zixibacteria bacterium]
MRRSKSLALVLSGALMLSSSVMATGVSIKVSGAGAVNDSTIKAGQKVSLDIYYENDQKWMGFTSGFKISSPTIKKIEHAADTVKGLLENGSIKGHNGWQDRSVWDFGFYVTQTDWDGNLPDIVGFAGLAARTGYQPQKKSKMISIDIVVPEAGIIVVDSSFFPPGGYWKTARSSAAEGNVTGHPKWGGPYTFKVVK